MVESAGRKHFASVPIDVIGEGPMVALLGQVESTAFEAPEQVRAFVVRLDQPRRHFNVQTIGQRERAAIEASMVHDAKRDAVRNRIRTVLGHPTDVGGLDAESPVSELRACAAHGASAAVGIENGSSELRRT